MTAGTTILPLKVNGVSFKPGEKKLLKDVSLTLEAGKATIILGPNGAGKSLFLRICHGLLAPSEGTVEWHGANGDDPRKHPAMVFQRPVMLRRSAGANIDYALKLHDVPARQRRERVAEAMQMIGLGRFIDQPARLLSGGEQQRLAIARAWALRPQVLFLDEPTASLDPAATHSIEEAIEAFKAAGTKIIMTTHDLGQAKRLAGEVLFLHRGRILERADADAFFAGPKNDLAQAFLKGDLLWWKRKELQPPSERHHIE